MKSINLLLIIFILASCKSNSKKVSAYTSSVKPAHVLPATYKTGNSIKASADTSDIDDSNQYTTCYVVVVDTGNEYNMLKDKMLSIHNSFNIPIDTMRRSYSKVKDLIVLPDNDEDEVYAGDYLPRQTVSDFLSLEYMLMYKVDSKNKTIALVRGIYDNKERADSALKIINSPKAFTLKSSIFQGCIH